MSLTDRLTGVGSRDAWALPITMTMTMLPRRCPNIEMQICQRALSLPARAALVDKCFTHQHHHHHHHHHQHHHHYHHYDDNNDDYGGVGDNNDYDDGSDFFDDGGVVVVTLMCSNVTLLAIKTSKREDQLSVGKLVTLLKSEYLIH